MSLLSSTGLTADAFSMTTYLTELGMFSKFLQSYVHRAGCFNYIAGCIMQREVQNFPTEEVENLKWLSDTIKQMVRVTYTTVTHSTFSMKFFMYYFYFAGQ